MDLFKLLKSVGVPYRYRNKTSKISEPKIIRSTQFGKIKRINVGDQKKWISKFKKERLNYSFVLGISSFPTDFKAMQASTYLLAKEFKKEYNFKAKYINASQVKIKEIPQWHDVNDVKIVVIHNITANSTDQRIQIVRDLITIYNESFVILVCATNDIVSMFKFKLCLPVDCVLHF